MTTFLYSLMALVLAGGATAQEVSVPSGLKVALFDVIVEDDPATARFRFLAPDIQGSAVGYEAVVDDFRYLCDTLAAPALAENGWENGDIVLSFSAKELPFGTTAADVTQYFQPFRLEEGICKWEDY